MKVKKQFLLVLVSSVITKGSLYACLVSRIQILFYPWLSPEGMPTVWQDTDKEWGLETGTQVPFGNSVRLASIIGAELCELEDCGHIPFEECPDRFMKIMKSFIAAHNTTQSP